MLYVCCCAVAIRRGVLEFEKKKKTYGAVECTGGIGRDDRER